MMDHPPRNQQNFCNSFSKARQDNWRSAWNNNVKLPSDKTKKYFTSKCNSGGTLYQNQSNQVIKKSGRNEMFVNKPETIDLNGNQPARNNACLKRNTKGSLFFNKEKQKNVHVQSNGEKYESAVDAHNTITGIPIQPTLNSERNVFKEFQHQIKRKGFSTPSEGVNTQTPFPEGKYLDSFVPCSKPKFSQLQHGKHEHNFLKNKYCENHENQNSFMPVSNSDDFCQVEQFWKHNHNFLKDKSPQNHGNINSYVPGAQLDFSQLEYGQHEHNLLKDKSPQNHGNINSYVPGTQPDFSQLEHGKHKHNFLKDKNPQNNENMNSYVPGTHPDLSQLEHGQPEHNFLKDKRPQNHGNINSDVAGAQLDFSQLEHGKHVHNFLKDKNPQNNEDINSYVPGTQPDLSQLQRGQHEHNFLKDKRPQNHGNIKSYVAGAQPNFSQPEGGKHSHNSLKDKNPQINGNINSYVSGTQPDFSQFGHGKHEHIFLKDKNPQNHGDINSAQPDFSQLEHGKQEHNFLKDKNFQNNGNINSDVCGIQHDLSQLEHGKHKHNFLIDKNPQNNENLKCFVTGSEFDFSRPSHLKHGHTFARDENWQRHENRRSPSNIKSCLKDCSSKSTKGYKLKFLEEVKVFQADGSETDMQLVDNKVYKRYKRPIFKEKTSNQKHKVTQNKTKESTIQTKNPMTASTHTNSIPNQEQLKEGLDVSNRVMRFSNSTSKDAKCKMVTDKNSKIVRHKEMKHDVVSKAICEMSANKTQPRSLDFVHIKSKRSQTKSKDTIDVSESKHMQAKGNIHQLTPKVNLMSKISLGYSSIKDKSNSEYGEKPDGMIPIHMDQNVVHGENYSKGVCEVKGSVKSDFSLDSKGKVNYDDSHISCIQFTEDITGSDVRNESVEENNERDRNGKATMDAGRQELAPTIMNLEEKNSTNCLKQISQHMQSTEPNIEMDQNACTEYHNRKTYIDFLKNINKNESQNESNSKVGNYSKWIWVGRDQVMDNRGPTLEHENKYSPGENVEQRNKENIFEEIMCPGTLDFLNNFSGIENLCSKCQRSIDYSVLIHVGTDSNMTGYADKCSNDKKVLNLPSSRLHRQNTISNINFKVDEEVVVKKTDDIYSTSNQASKIANTNILESNSSHLRAHYKPAIGQLKEEKTSSCSSSNHTTASKSRENQTEEKCLKNDEASSRKNMFDSVNKHSMKKQVSNQIESRLQTKTKCYNVIQNISKKEEESNPIKEEKASMKKMPKTMYKESVETEAKRADKTRSYNRYKNSCHGTNEINRKKCQENIKASSSTNISDSMKELISHETKLGLQTKPSCNKAIENIANKDEEAQLDKAEEANIKKLPETNFREAIRLEAKTRTNRDAKAGCCSANENSSKKEDSIRYTNKYNEDKTRQDIADKISGAYRYNKEDKVICEGENRSKVLTERDTSDQLKHVKEDNTNSKDEDELHEKLEPMFCILNKMNCTNADLIENNRDDVDKTNITVKEKRLYDRDTSKICEQNTNKDTKAELAKNDKNFPIYLKDNTNLDRRICTKDGEIKCSSTDKTDNKDSTKHDKNEPGSCKLDLSNVNQTMINQETTDNKSEKYESCTNDNTNDIIGDENKYSTNKSIDDKLEKHCHKSETNRFGTDKPVCITLDRLDKVESDLKGCIELPAKYELADKGISILSMVNGNRLSKPDENKVDSVFSVNPDLSACKGKTRSDSSSVNNEESIIEHSQSSEANVKVEFPCFNQEKEQTSIPKASLKRFHESEDSKLVDALCGNRRLVVYLKDIMSDGHKLESETKGTVSSKPYINAKRFKRVLRMDDYDGVTSMDTSSENGRDEEKMLCKRSNKTSKENLIRKYRKDLDPKAKKSIDKEKKPDGSECKEKKREGSECRSILRQYVSRISNVHDRRSLVLKLACQGSNSGMDEMADKKIAISDKNDKPTFSTQKIVADLNQAKDSRQDEYKRKYAKKEESKKTSHLKSQARQLEKKNTDDRIILKKPKYMTMDKQRTGTERAANLSKEHKVEMMKTEHGKLIYAKDSANKNVSLYSESNDDSMSRSLDEETGSKISNKGSLTTDADIYKDKTSKDIKLKVNEIVKEMVNTTGRKTLSKAFKFICPACQKKFETNADLRLHSKESHPFLCHKCGLDFADKASKTKHGWTHVNVAFTCEQCKMKFRSEKTFRLHLNSMKHARVIAGLSGRGQWNKKEWEAELSQAVASIQEPPTSAHAGTDRNSSERAGSSMMYTSNDYGSKTVPKTTTLTEPFFLYADSNNCDGNGSSRTTSWTEFLAEPDVSISYDDGLASNCGSDNLLLTESGLSDSGLYSYTPVTSYVPYQSQSQMEAQAVKQFPTHSTVNVGDIRCQWEPSSDSDLHQVNETYSRDHTYFPSFGTADERGKLDDTRSYHLLQNMYCPATVEHEVSHVGTEKIQKVVLPYVRLECTEKLDISASSPRIC